MNKKHNITFTQRSKKARREHRAVSCIEWFWHDAVAEMRLLQPCLEYDHMDDFIEATMQELGLVDGGKPAIIATVAYCLAEIRTRSLLSHKDNSSNTIKE